MFNYPLSIFSMFKLSAWISRLENKPLNEYKVEIEFKDIYTYIYIFDAILFTIVCYPQ